MVDISNLPIEFSRLVELPIPGLQISERVIDPLIIILRDGNRIFARLAGQRVFRGERSTYLALSNDHDWIADEKIIRPLPSDVNDQFRSVFHGCNSDNLTYSEAVQLLRKPDVPVPIEANAEMLHCMPLESAESTEIKGLMADLFPYQAAGVKWMWDTISYTGGVILADEMGLGKTIQIISLFLMEPPSCNSPALIICPTSLIANWIREIDRFAPSLSILVHRGGNRTGIYRELQTVNIVITTYDTMVNDISLLSSFEWSWVVCDEAQALKNPDSNRRQAASKLVRRRTIPMTGTPVENSLLDLWSLADFAVPGLLGTRQDFDIEFPDTPESALALSQYTDPVILKRKVADVAGDLPERIDIDIPIEFDESEVAHYIDVRTRTLEKYPVAGALVATLQLQLVCAHPWLRCNDNDQEEFAQIERNSKYGSLLTPKMEVAISLLREAFINKKKVIVFCLFNRIGELIQEAAKPSQGVYWGAINGSTESVSRQRIVDEFSSHVGPGCLILNPKAAGAGLNITAATIVIHFTPVWNPALEAQASARSHRRGQTCPVTIYRLYYKDTVEEVMIGRAIWKSELANESVPVSSRNASDVINALQISPRK